jgi:hypothetical protein
MNNPRRRRLHHDPLRNPILWLGLILTCFLVLLLWEEVGNRIENFRSKKEVADPVINLTATQESLYVGDVNGPTDDMHRGKKDGEVLRRVYPYSVVQGGVHSIQELRSAIGRDPVVAKHYSNFKLDRARVIEASADGDFHVSYRIGHEIFWTKKRLKVAKSEKLMTDGTTFTRTRCANVLSEVFPGKTSPDEPTPEVFDTPTLPPSHLTPFTPPVVAGGGPPTTTVPPSEPTPFTPPGVIGGDPPATTLPPSGFIPPVVIGGGSPGPGGGNSPGPDPGPGPVPVPEPATVLLFVSGLLGLAGYGRRKFFKK